SHVSTPEHRKPGFLRNSFERPRREEIHVPFAQDAALPVTQQAEYQSVVSRCLDDQNTTWPKYSEQLTQRFAWIGDMLDDVDHQRGVVRVCLTFRARQGACNDIQSQYDPGMLAAQRVRIHARGDPAILPERAQQKSKPRAHLQEVAARREEACKNPPRRQIVSSLAAFLLHPGVVSSPQHLIEKRRIATRDSYEIERGRSRIDIHQPAAQAPHNLLRLCLSGGKEDPVVMARAQIATYVLRLRHRKDRLPGPCRRAARSLAPISTRRFRWISGRPEFKLNVLSPFRCRSGPHHATSFR